MPDLFVYVRLLSQLLEYEITFREIIIFRKIVISYRYVEILWILCIIHREYIQKIEKITGSFQINQSDFTETSFHQ